MNIKLLNACLLIIGTSIGAGMLGLPVETSLGGFIPSAFFLLFTWIVTLITGLLFIEVLLYLKKDVNFVSLSSLIIGNVAKYLIFGIYILLFMSLIFAYVKSGGIFFSDIFKTVLPWQGSLIFLLIFVPFIFFGTKAVGGINTFMTIGLVISFFSLISLGINKIDYSFLKYQNWGKGFLTLPFLVTSFGFHSIMPTLVNYLERDAKNLRKAVIIGTSVTFGIYFIWQLIVTGIIPLNGEHGLITALMKDETAITPMKYYLNNDFLSKIAQVFYFTALATSFLGVSLGLIDFLADAFSWKKNYLHKWLLLIFVYLPALILSSTSLRIFYFSLKFGAGIACTILLILLPAILTFKIRTNPQGNVIYRVKGGIFVLSFVLLFVILIFLSETINYIF